MFVPIPDSVYFITARKLSLRFRYVTNYITDENIQWYKPTICYYSK